MSRLSNANEAVFDALERLADLCDDGLADDVRLVLEGVVHRATALLGRCDDPEGWTDPDVEEEYHDYDD